MNETEIILLEHIDILTTAIEDALKECVYPMSKEDVAHIERILADALNIVWGMN